MRTVVQRVRSAAVEINGSRHAAIGPGLLVLLGVEPIDTPDDVEWLATKIANLRVFDDDAGVMNRSVCDAGGDILLVSQFTLLASTRKGNRPSYARAARPEIAIPLYESFRDRLSAILGRPVPTGVFGADMQVSLVNDGPVTLCIDSRARE